MEGDGGMGGWGDGNREEKGAREVNGSLGLSSSRGGKKRDPGNKVGRRETLGTTLSGGDWEK